jgi:hypothetical protein
VPKKRGYKVSVAVVTTCVAVGSVPVIVAVCGIIVSVEVALGSGDTVSVAVAVTDGNSVSVAVGSRGSVAGIRVGVGSALRVSAAKVAAIAASVACASTAGVTVGCPRKGAGMQALRIKTVARIRTAVLFMTGSVKLVE